MRDPAASDVHDAQHGPDADLVAVGREREVLRQKMRDLAKENERDRSHFEEKLQQMKEKLDAKV